MPSNDSCPLCEVAKRFHDVAVSQRDAARRERDDLSQENEILRARADNAHSALRAAEQREQEALAALDEAIALIRVIIDADCLQPHAFEQGDDDASVYEACKHLIHRHKK